jgi:ribosomal protein L37E
VLGYRLPYSVNLIKKYLCPACGLGFQEKERFKKYHEKVAENKQGTDFQSMSPT